MAKLGKDKNAQFSIEYIAVTAFGLVVLLGAISLIYIEYNSNAKQIQKSDIGAIVKELADASGKIYYMGEPAKTTLTMAFPNGIANVCIGGILTEASPALACADDEITFLFKDNSHISFTTQNKITMFPSTKKVRINEGIHNIKIEAESNLLGILGPACQPATCDPATCPQDCTLAQVPGVIISQD